MSNNAATHRFERMFQQKRLKGNSCQIDLTSCKHKKLHPIINFSTGKISKTIKTEEKKKI